MAEHEKSKPELPTRPPRPHPQGFRLVAVVASVVAVLLAACGPGQGPAGTVVGKDRYYMGKAWHYRLTTQGSDGARHEFKVLRSDYNACYRGSVYPKCTEVR